jgi:hypothetical protein
MSAIIASEIVYRYTTTAGSAGDTTANTTVSTFLGKYAATSAWAGGGTNDLFPDITGAQNAASQVDYAGLAILNNNAANSAQNSVAYISSEVAGGASVAVALTPRPRPRRARRLGAAGHHRQLHHRTGRRVVLLADHRGHGVSLGTIPVANVKGLWVRRTAANSAALSTDGATLAVQVDTGSL